MTKKKHRVNAPEVADQARRGSSPLYPSLPKMPPSADRRPTAFERQIALAEELDRRKRMSVNDGKKGNRQKNYLAWKEWREDAMKECKKVLRADREVKRATVLRRLQKMNPNLATRKLERAVDGWKERAQRIEWRH